MPPERVRTRLHDGWLAGSGWLWLALAGSDWLWLALAGRSAWDHFGRNVGRPVNRKLPLAGSGWIWLAPGWLWLALAGSGYLQGVRGACPQYVFKP